MILGYFQPICFVFNTRRPPYNVPRLYDNAPIMASPFCMVIKTWWHMPFIVKKRIQEFKRKEREKRRNELYEINGSKNNHVMEDDNNTTNNDNMKKIIKNQFKTKKS